MTATTAEPRGCAPKRSEEYNGWTNRETWACALHLSNTEWLYGLALAYARQDEWGGALAEWVMVGDVGSLWRVDWKAVRDGLVED